MLQSFRVTVKMTEEQKQLKGDFCIGEGLKEVMDTVNSVECQSDVLSSVMCDAE